MSNARVVPNRAAQVRERQIQRTQSRVEQTVKNINPNPKRPSPTIHTRGQISGMVYPTLPVKKNQTPILLHVGPNWERNSLPGCTTGSNRLAFFVFHFIQYLFFRHIFSF